MGFPASTLRNFPSILIDARRMRNLSQEVIHDGLDALALVNARVEGGGNGSDFVIAWMTSSMLHQALDGQGICLKSSMINRI